MNQLTQFNAGGTHEQNPLGGIPQGADNQGVPNLVEEGETKLDAENYIFSDRLKVDREIAGIFNLPSKFIGKTFAEVSKKLDFSDSRREGDKIEENQSKKDLSMLMEAQEKFKELDLEKDLAMMKEKHPEFMEFLEQSSQGVPQEQMMQDPNMMQNPEQGGEMVDPNQQGQPQMAPEQMQQMNPGMQEGVPQLPIPGMRYGGSMFAMGGMLGDPPGPGDKKKKGDTEKPKGKYDDWDWKNDPIPRPVTQDYQKTPEYEKASAATKNALDYEHNNTVMFNTDKETWEPYVGSTRAGASQLPLYSEFTGAEADGTWKHPVSNFTHYNPDGTKRQARYPKEVLDTQVYSNQTINESPANIRATGGYNDITRFEDSAAQSQEEEQNTQNTIGGIEKGATTVVGAINPLAGMVVGAALGAGNAIGKPIKKAAEKRNEDGTLKSDSAAQAGYVANSIFNPASGGIRSLMDKDLTGGQRILGLVTGGISNTKRYTDKLNKEGKVAAYKQDQSEEAQQIFQQTASETYYANGGKMNYFDGRGSSFMQSGPPYGDKGYYTGELSDEELAQEAVKAEQQRMIDSGKEVPFIPQGQTDLSYFSKNESDATLQNKDKYDDIETDPYQRNNFKQPENTDANTDYRFNQTLLNTAGTYAPTIYNLAKGIFGKQDKRKLEDYYKEVEAYKMNIDPQLRETEQSFAAGQNAIRNAGTGSSYLATMKQMADSRNKSFADLHGQKQQFDIAQKYNTDILNNQNRAQTQMFVDDYNARAKTAKTNYLQEGLKQVGDISQNDTQNKLAMQYNRLYAPDFAGQTGRVSLLEQGRNYMNARRAKQGK